MRPKLVHILLVLFTGMALGTIGGFVGGLLEMTAFGAIAGAVLGLTLGIALASKHTPWWVLSLVVALLAGSYLLGGWGSLALSVAILALVYVTSTLVLFELYGVGRWRAFWMHLRMIAGLDYGFHVIRDGVTQAPRDVGDKPLLGPRLIVVSSGSAAVMVKGGRQTRILGPGSALSARFEYVRHTFDLQPRQRVVALDDALTSDGLIVSVRIALTYGFAVSEQACRGEIALTEEERAHIQWISDEALGWEQVTLAMVERALRQTVAMEPLSRFISADGQTGPNLPRSLHKVEMTTLAVARQMLASLGVQVQRIVIQSVQPGQELAQARKHSWLAQDVARTTKVLQVGRASAWKEAITQIVQAYANARKNDMDTPQMSFELLRQLIEMLARDPDAQPFLTAELLHSIGDLGKGDGR